MPAGQRARALAKPSFGFSKGSRVSGVPKPIGVLRRFDHQSRFITYHGRRCFFEVGLLSRWVPLV